jgi:hypothetical protein
VLNRVMYYYFKTFEILKKTENKSRMIKMLVNKLLLLYVCYFVKFPILRLWKQVSLWATNLSLQGLYKT